MDHLYYNLWDTKCNEIGGVSITQAILESVTKSVYDPCPPGFCLPPNGAFTGFTESGNNSYTSSELNVSGSFDKGWHFRTVLKDETGSETIFFPASGYREADESLLDGVGGYGCYWSSAPYHSYNPFYGCNLYFYSDNVFPLYNGMRSFGYVMRPVKEN